MEMQYANTQRQTEIAEAYLKLIIGTPLEDEIILSDSLEQLLNASVNFKLEEAQIENRLEYKMADMKIRLKELDTDTNQIIFQLYLRSPQLEEMLWE